MAPTLIYRDYKVNSVVWLPNKSALSLYTITKMIFRKILFAQIKWRRLDQSKATLPINDTDPYLS
jgi:hypothetical protein